MAEPTGSARARTTLSALRARIASGEWPVGSRIPTEPELAELLGVGRSTVREAIRSLATLGMLETLTARGTFVRSATPSPALLLDALAGYTADELGGLRRALDVEAAQTAAARRTDADLAALDAALRAETDAARDSVTPSCGPFHRAVVRASGNRLLADLDASLAAVFDAAGHADQVAQGIDVAVRVDAHDRIVTAIRGRDVGRAAHQMALHADAALRSLGSTSVVTDLAPLLAVDDVEAGARRGRGIA